MLHLDVWTAGQIFRGDRFPARFGIYGGYSTPLSPSTRFILGRAAKKGPLFDASPTASGRSASSAHPDLMAEDRIMLGDDGLLA